MRKKTQILTASYTFDELETNVKGIGKISDAEMLAKMEEDWIRAGDGPGVLENMRHEMNNDRYKKAGGHIH